MTPDDYMQQIVDPAVADLRANPASPRHAFVACVLVFHAIDYLAGTRRKVIVRGEFAAQSAAFAAVDRLAHGRQRPGPAHPDRPTGIAHVPAVLGLVTDAVAFLKSKIQTGATPNEPPVDDTYFVVVPFDENHEGDIEAGLAEEVRDAATAERRARILARQHAGAIAFSRSGDPATGEFEDAVILARFGKVGPVE